jgi:hypothetical protein
MRNDKAYWKRKAEDLTFEVDVLKQQLDVNMRELNRLKELQSRKPLLNELGHLMECNAKLAEAAAKIISPGTH